MQGSRAQRRILARSGLARYSAPSVREKPAVRLQTTWIKMHQQWVVLWTDNWYSKQFTTNPDKNDKSLNATALAVLLLRDAPRYWHGHPSLEELERRVPVVARMLGNTEGTFARILRDLGFASTRPVVRIIGALLDIIRPVPAKRPHWQPLCLSKEKVSGKISLLNLLQFIRDLAQHTRPVVPVLCDENIHYRICKMMYGEKTTGWNVRLFLRSHPILYGFWHAYKFCVAQTFRSFWPIVTFFRKGLLRSGDTVPCFPKLITLEITFGALLLGMGPHIRRLNRKWHSLGLAHPANRRSSLWYAVCKAMQVLLTQYCPPAPEAEAEKDSDNGVPVPTPPVIPEEKDTEKHIPVPSPPEVPVPKESEEQVVKEEKVESAVPGVREHQDSGEDSPAAPVGQEEIEEVGGAPKDEEMPACKQEDNEEAAPEVGAPVPHLKEEPLPND